MVVYPTGYGPGAAKRGSAEVSIVAVAVGVTVGVADALAVGGGVAVSVAVPEAVAVDADVAVRVGALVAVAVAVAVGRCVELLPPQPASRITMARAAMARPDPTAGVHITRPGFRDCDDATTRPQRKSMCRGADSTDWRRVASAVLRARGAVLGAAVGWRHGPARGQRTPVEFGATIRLTLRSFQPTRRRCHGAQRTDTRADRGVHSRRRRGAVHEGQPVDA